MQKMDDASLQQKITAQKASTRPKPVIWFNLKL